MEVITSLDNKKIKEYAKLLKKKYRDLNNKFLIEGRHLVLEALKSGYLEEVILTYDEVIPIEVKKTYVTKEVIKKLTNVLSVPDIVGVCKKLEEKEIGDKVIVLDGLQDPGNLGTIIRSAVAFGVDTIVLSDDCVDLYNDKVIRATQGMIFHINIVKRNLLEFLPRIKNEYQIIGTKVTHGIEISDIDLQDKYAFILGNEGQGVKEEVLDLCDCYANILMDDMCESLNVGVASSIIMYELYKKGRKV